jgi:murein DD-endopeptidase MepM/ murein hydrolase activator NlpD
LLGKRGREKNFTPGISAGKSGHNSGMEVLPLKKRTIWNKIGDFLEGKGFYIVLFLCVAAIGGSGYYLYRMVSLSGELPTQAVSAQAEVPADAARQDDVEITVDDEDGEAKNKAETTGQTAEQTAKTEESPTAKAEGDQDLEAEPSAKATETKTEETEPTAGQSKDGPAVTTSGTAARWSWPVEGEVAEAFSVEELTYNQAMGDWRTHSGIDIAAKVGDPVAAAMDGTVISVKDDVMLGKTVTIQTAEGLNTVYGNLAEDLSVTSGDKVKAGQAIGKVGETAAGEQHDTAWLHFAVEQDGKAVDPMSYLK